MRFHQIRIFVRESRVMIERNMSSGRNLRNTVQIQNSNERRNARTTEQNIMEKKEVKKKKKKLEGIRIYRWRHLTEFA